MTTRPACQNRTFGRYASWLVAPMVLMCSGCWNDNQPQVAVYAALDREFSGPILADFQQQTGTRVLAKYDDESTKSVGLTNVLIQEAHRPRCDVFWNNEILNTLRLQQRGLLEVYQPPLAAEYPEQFRSPTGHWSGFAARARVLIVNTRLVADGEHPQSISALADPKWRGRGGIARPIAGTTATHVACLFAMLGPDKAEEYLRSLKKNSVQILGGNKQVAQACAAGQIAFGLTDTDDALIEIERGAPVAIVYPDQGPGGLGTLFIPNTLAIMKNCPHPEQARRLCDYLLSSSVEARLAAGPSAQIPLNPAVAASPRVETPRSIKAMEIDFTQAAAAWDTAAKFIESDFLAP